MTKPDHDNRDTSDAVLVALADSRYLEQAKQLFSSGYWNSGWTGDFLLLAYETPDEDLEWFRKKGVHVKRCAPMGIRSEKIGDQITASKCHLFSQAMTRWRQVVYLDVDILTRLPLHSLAAVPSFSACPSFGQAIRDNLIAGHLMPDDTVRELAARVDLDAQSFNSGVLAFPTSIIERNMFSELVETFDRYVPYGLFGGDQLPFNIFFHQGWDELPAAFNQMVTLRDTQVDVRSLQGAVIHVVSFGTGPWEESSPFKSEWQYNLDRADGMDLRHPLDLPDLSPEEVAGRSRAVRRRYLSKGRIGLSGLLNFAWRALVLALMDPAKLVRKLRLLLR